MRNLKPQETARDDPSLFVWFFTEHDNFLWVLGLEAGKAEFTFRGSTISSVEETSVFVSLIDRETICR